MRGFKDRLPRATLILTSPISRYGYHTMGESPEPRIDTYLLHLGLEITLTYLKTLTRLNTWALGLNSQSTRHL